MTQNKKQLREFAKAFGSAVISECGNYRYRLERTWDSDKPAVAFVMLNPSTADASEDDPTVRRCIAFARSWGYGRLIIGNLFALRSSDPLILKVHPEPVGPFNDLHLLQIAKDAEEVVCAWGAHGSLRARDDEALRFLSGKRTVALKRTNDGSPGHPLYIKSTAERLPFAGK